MQDNNLEQVQDMPLADQSKEKTLDYYFNPAFTGTLCRWRLCVVSEHEASEQV